MNYYLCKFMYLTNESFSEVSHLCILKSESDLTQLSSDVLQNLPDVKDLCDEYDTDEICLEELDEGEWQEYPDEEIIYVNAEDVNMASEQSIVSA